jgi:hypothetical protein
MPPKPAASILMLSPDSRPTEPAWDIFRSPSPMPVTPCLRRDRLAVASEETPPITTAAARVRTAQLRMTLYYQY